MASPPCLLFRPSPPLCSRRRRSRPPSPYLLSKQSLHRLPSPRTCRRPVVAAVAKQLVPRPPGTGRRTGATGFACHCSYDTKNGLPTPPPDKGKSSDEWPVLRRWDVPWEWPTISLTMVACAVSFLLTGMVEQFILEQLGFQAGGTTLDEKAEILFLGQLSTTVVVLGVIFGITGTFRPFSDDIFRYEFKEPFKLQNGWLLWSGIGLFVAVVAIALAGAAMTFVNGETPQREHCLFAGHHWDFGTHSGGNCVSRISYGIPDYVVLYSICCAYHCCNVCLCSSYTRRIPTAFCAWCCLRIFICSNPQSSNSYCHTCCLELWSNIVANLSSDARV
ncbi:uncharacterized protein LOC8077828 isoform X3 [Sorghum bicolor]|uniref:uncharacterized protein LOC8077828 isoform X3 n=1 Tax=Sorghum bicolor TaxID=4558 RepID=UPI000B425237|nr:uncharacterized protein LOC8077828 isoform X3 [Sorghum bicolor]|eukprot:XP_021320116.1 uncharacterized protein LOC8077828 isoform X3 [Sorghum bicolor]